MGVFAAGQVVVMPFPFSDLSRSKYRPALLLADVGHRDFIACQITSNPYSDSCAVTLNNSHFDQGGLAHVSYIRPGKLFTVHEDLLGHAVGNLKPAIIEQAREAVIQMVRGYRAPSG